MNDFDRLLIGFFQSEQAAEAIDLIATEIVKIMKAEEAAV